MTAFDRAWRRSREDSMIAPLQQAYDKEDGYENVQHFIHVADPIETFMPNSDKPEKMFRDHLEPTNLVNDEGKYLDSEESWRNMQDDIANLARPRKGRKKSKYARIFVPNPESKRDKIGDFHLDESKSEEWQEKLASEQMTAFDTAWSLMKEKCDKTNRIFRNNKPSIILVCNREKGHQGSCEWKESDFEYDDRDLFPPMGGGINDRI